MVPTAWPLSGPELIVGGPLACSAWLGSILEPLWSEGDDVYFIYGFNHAFNYCFSWVFSSLLLSLLSVCIGVQALKLLALCPMLKSYVYTSYLLDMAKFLLKLLFFFSFSEYFLSKDVLKILDLYKLKRENDISKKHPKLQKCGFLLYYRLQKVS